MSATGGAINASPLKQRRLNPSRLSESWRRRLPLFPALLFTIVLTQVPFVMSIYYSLTNWHIVPPGSRKFIGLRNYGDLLSDHFFRSAVWTSIELTAVPVIGALI